MAIASIPEGVFLDIFFDVEMRLAPGDVGNSGPLLPLLVRLSIWHVV